MVKSVISALTIKDVDKVPLLFVCTTPTLFSPSMVTFPDPFIFILSLPVVLNDNVLLAALKPVLVLPKNCNEGDAEDPDGNIKVPVIVSPAFSTFNEAAPVTDPVKLAVIVP